MTSLPASPRNRREEILVSSASLFRQKGFGASSIRDIAAVLEIKSASLYYHFENKEEILFAIAHGVMLDFVEEVTPVLKGDGTSNQRIAAVVEAHLRFDVANLDRVLVSSQERRAMPERRQRPINTLRRRHRRELERVVAQGIESGEIRVADPKVATPAVLDLISGVKEWYEPRGRGELDQLISTYQSYVLSLLRVADR